MRVNGETTRAFTCSLLLTVCTLLTGCGGGAATPEPSPSPSIAPPPEPQARAQLAALAAAALDRTVTAAYTLRTRGRPDRTVGVTLAPDRSWRVDIPGSALGGTADVAIVNNDMGLYQCALPSPGRPAGTTCVRVGERDDAVPTAIDPGVQRPFTTVRGVLTDQSAAVSISTAAPIDGAAGSCFAVESTTASVNAPLDVGIYCYDEQGTLTAARLALGTLTLAGTPAVAPATVGLPGPVSTGDPLGLAAPPPPPTPATSPTSSAG